jgi:hypothetical protein
VLLQIIQSYSHICTAADLYSILWMKPRAFEIRGHKSSSTVYESVPKATTVLNHLTIQTSGAMEPDVFVTPALDQDEWSVFTLWPL